MKEFFIIYLLMVDRKTKVDFCCGRPYGSLHNGYGQLFKAYFSATLWLPNDSSGDQDLSMYVDGDLSTHDPARHACCTVSTPPVLK